MNISKQKILFLSLLTIFVGISSVQADCIYSTELAAEEFEIGNMLTWSTSNEVDNKSFAIEKSTDGVTFINIGRVKGSGTFTGVKEYRFLDVSAGKGQTHYRLKQINVDGTHNYSKLASIQKDGGNNFTVVAMTTPTDNDQVFEVTLNATSEDYMDYKIYDMKGNLVYTQKQQLKKGINVISVDISEINESNMGFAGNNDMLGDKVGYKVSLEGKYEAEMLTIAPRNKDIVTNKVRN